MSTCRSCLILSSFQWLQEIKEKKKAQARAALGVRKSPRSHSMYSMVNPLPLRRRRRRLLAPQRRRQSWVPHQRRQNWVPHQRRQSWAPHQRNERYCTVLLELGLNLYSSTIWLNELSISCWVAWMPPPLNLFRQCKPASLPL